MTSDHVPNRISWAQRGASSSFRLEPIHRTIVDDRCRWSITVRQPQKTSFSLAKILSCSGTIPIMNLLPKPHPPQHRDVLISSVLPPCCTSNLFPLGMIVLSLATKHQVPCNCTFMYAIRTQTTSIQPKDLTLVVTS
jgi:hypothetical protein